MKKLVALISIALAAATIAIVACAKPPLPTRVGANAPHRLGVQLNDAGFPVDDSGAVSLFLEAGIPSVLGDPPIDHCTVDVVNIDPPTCNFAAHVTCGPRARLVQGTLTQAQCGAVFNLVKQAAAAGGIQ
jgi:hypothetical protein